jgi:hypothetical protein
MAEITDPALIKFVNQLRRVVEITRGLDQTIEDLNLKFTNIGGPAVFPNTDFVVRVGDPDITGLDIKTAGAVLLEISNGVDGVMDGADRRLLFEKIAIVPLFKTQLLES